MGQGLAELDKALGPDRISRMLLLTDGQTFGDEKQCKKLGEQAGDKGIVVNALGLGDDWNEDLLDEIAEASGGGGRLYRLAGQDRRPFSSRPSSRCRIRSSRTPRWSCAWPAASRPGRCGRCCP